MTAHVDPRLLQVRDKQRTLRETAGADATLPPARIIVTFTGALADLEALGFMPESVLGQIAGGDLCRCARRADRGAGRSTGVGAFAVHAASQQERPTCTPTRFARVPSTSTAPT